MELEKILFVITVFIICILMVWQYIVITNEIKMLKNTTVNTSENTNQSIPTNENYYAQNDPSYDMMNNQPIIAPMRVIIPTREYDYSAYSDPLTPPYRRDDYNTPMVGLPTRGFPSTFKKMGTLISTDDSIPMNDPYKFMFLMGRETYPGSNSYDYYVVEKDSDGKGVLKFDLSCNKSTKLYNDGDEIKVKELSRNYKIKMDQLDQFTYNPYLM